MVEKKVQRSQAPTARRAPLRLRVAVAAERILRSGHPWLFAENIRAQNRPGEVGELAVIYDRNDRFLALGLFDPNSPIRVRILHAGKPRELNAAFWQSRLEPAFARRDGLFDAQTTGFRWINGESDGWPGLVLDRYGASTVLKLYTAAWLPWLDQIVQLLNCRLRPERIVLRLSRNAQQLAADRFGRHDGEIVNGAPLKGPVVFLENRLQFQADVLRGQKTGFFLDQRENRSKVETLAPGRSVLNAFSFSGGFSLYAARGGASSVTDLDISAHALAEAEKNFTLNRSCSAIRSCRREQIQSDAFDWFAGNPSRRFELLILDPPSFARRESDRARALVAYSRLVSLGLSHLKANGVLVACSCSAHVSEDQFFEAVRGAVGRSRRPCAELARGGQPADHPASIPEARYLKSIYLRVG
ncbi:MAG TPA: class I SAM-dependent rRNA methyltransferase [Patescibacteria group bacterium]|nr:class I SAM-dependent rRNA methyltransferase [Patescibacteria group bacterium]